MRATATRPRLSLDVEETRACCIAALGRLDGDAKRRGQHPPAPLEVRQLAAGGARAAEALAAFDPNDHAGRAAAVQQSYIAAALDSLDRLTVLPVVDSVRSRFCSVFRDLCQTPGISDRRFRPDLEYQSRALAACAVLERFPAGQLDWEVSGLPRSYLWKMPLADVPRVLRVLASDLQGVRPCFAAHMGVRRYPLLFVEVENHRSYYRIAESMALQPDVKGLIMASWYHSEETIRVSPHLAWTNRTPMAYGAFLTHIGEASPDDGFLVGSEQRRKLFEAGKYRPTVGLVIWPRRNLLAWAAAHPEFAAEAGTG